MSAPMIRALLAGTKTQTRRIVKPQPRANTVKYLNGIEREKGRWWPISKNDYSGDAIRCPYGVPGDRLWVREKHCFLDVTKSALSQFPLGPQNKNELGPDVWNVGIEYADGTEHETNVEGAKPKQTRERGELGWRPSIFMPRWASRITLELTGVRVERLNSISEADAKAEGIFLPGAHSLFTTDRLTGAHGGRTACESYRLLWEDINGPGSWEANPWVFALTFKRIS